MSAEIFGANLLEEVQGQSLNELLTDLRYTLESEQQCSTGVGKLDHLLSVFLQLPQVGNATTTEASTHGEATGTVVPDDRSHFRHRSDELRFPIVELGHSTPSTARNAFLYYLTAAAILPQKYGCKEATVVWLDTDVNFSATRLYQSCITHLPSDSGNTLQPSAKAEIAQEALKHVHVFSISSSKQLMAVLDSLQDYLFQAQLESDTTKASHQSMHRPLSLIILDSATAFHWPDRWDTELRKLEGVKAFDTLSTATQQAGLDPPNPARTLSALKTIQSTFHCTIVYTTTTPPPIHSSRRHQNPAPAPMTSNPDSTLPTMPRDDDSLTAPTVSPWSAAANLSLTLTRLPVPQFASHMNLDECLRDRAKRQDIVRLNRVRVGVCEEWFGSVVKHGERGGEISQALAEMDGRGAFVIGISSEGVDVE